MNFHDDLFDSDSNSFIDDEHLKIKVQKCKEYVSNGQTITFLGNIEDTIQLCLEYDLTEDGIYLAEAALKISPYSADLWHSKGIFYNNLFEFEKAYLCFNKALSLNPSDIDVMINKSISEENLGMREEAISTLETALYFDQSNEEVLFNLGIFYEKKDQFTKAIDLFMRTIAIDEDYGDAWYELGYCYENINQLNKANDAYEKFLDIEPYSASGWYNYGIVHLRLDNYEKAISCFELATAINDEFANAWYNCGLAYYKLNRFTESRKAFLKAFEIDPFDELIPLNIAHAYEATGEYEKAIHYFNETLTISRSNIDAYVGLGNCFARQNNYDEMLKNFSLVIKYSIAGNYLDKSPEHLINRVNIIYDEIKEYCPNSASIDCKFELADSYFELGRWSDALNVYESLRLKKVDTATTYYGMALCLFMLNKNDKALEYLNYSFELNPSNEVSFLEDFSLLESTQLFIKLTASI